MVQEQQEVQKVTFQMAGWLKHLSTTFYNFRIQPRTDDRWVLSVSFWMVKKNLFRFSNARILPQNIKIQTRDSEMSLKRT